MFSTCHDAPNELDFQHVQLSVHAERPLRPLVQAAAERARKEVLFWKDQLDHAVNEKKSLLERYTELYRHSFELEQAVVSLNTENTELRHVLDRTVVLHDERKTVGGSATPTSETGASTPVSP